MRFAGIIVFHVNSFGCERQIQCGCVVQLFTGEQALTRMPVTIWNQSFMHVSFLFYQESKLQQVRVKTPYDHPLRCFVFFDDWIPAEAENMSGSAGFLQQLNWFFKALIL